MTLDEDRHKNQTEDCESDFYFFILFLFFPSFYTSDDGRLYQVPYSDCIQPRPDLIKVLYLCHAVCTVGTFLRGSMSGTKFPSHYN